MEASDLVAMLEAIRGDYAMRLTALEIDNARLHAIIKDLSAEARVLRGLYRDSVGESE